IGVALLLLTAASPAAALTITEGFVREGLIPAVGDVELSGPNIFLSDSDGPGITIVSIGGLLQTTVALRGGGTTFQSIRIGNTECGFGAPFVPPCEVTMVFTSAAIDLGDSAPFTIE